MTKSVLDEVAVERERQDQKWGGPQHDNHHSVNVWERLIDAYNGKHSPGFAEQMAKAGSMPWRERFVKIAALAVAAVEFIDRTEPCKTCGESGTVNIGRFSEYKWVDCPVCLGAKRVPKETSNV